MALRFAILKQIDEGDEKVVLEYDEGQILERLQVRTGENLKESVFRRSFSKNEVAEAQAKAFHGLVSEFKSKTVRIP